MYNFAPAANTRRHPRPSRTPSLSFQFMRVNIAFGMSSFIAGQIPFFQFDSGK